MTLIFKQGDTRHAIHATLKDVQGNTVDLSAATVRFKMRHYLQKNVVIHKLPTVDGDNAVHVVFDTGDTDVPGLYKGEFTVTYADDRIETFPSSGYIEIKIEDKIGGVI